MASKASSAHPIEAASSVRRWPGVACRISWSGPIAMRPKGDRRIVKRVRGFSNLELWGGPNSKLEYLLPCYLRAHLARFLHRNRRFLATLLLSRQTMRGQCYENPIRDLRARVSFRLP